MKKKSLFINLTWAVLAIVMAFTACPNPAGNEDVADKTELSAAIEQAGTAKAGVVGSSDGKNVAAGTKWVLIEILDMLNNAISEAETVYYDASATQAQVDAAVIALETVTSTFNNMKQDKNSGFDQAGFDKLKADANIALTGVTVSADGNGVPVTSYWVTQTVKKTLEDAIASAGTQVTDQAYLDLYAALAVFNSAKNPGSGSSGSEGDDTDDALAGTWVSGDFLRLVASNDSFRQYRVSDDKEVVRGTYTGSGNAVTATITEVNTAIFGGQDRWYTWANLPSEYKGLMGGSQTQQITITGNTFIISGITFTKQNGTGDGGKEGGGKEGGGDAAFEGTWESDDNFLRLEASNGSFTQYMFAPDFFGEFVRGTYTVSGNAVTATITQINTAMFGGADAWVSWANLSDAQKASMGGSATQQITITGNTFTSNGMTFTKKNGTGGEGGGGGSEGGSGGGSGNTLIIGGIPSSMVSSGYSGSVIIGIFPSGTSSEQAVLWTGIVAGADSSNGDVGLSTSGSGSYTATAALYALLPDGTPAGSRWTGSGTFDIYLIVNGSSYYRATSVRFSSGTTTVSVSAFFPVTPGSDQPPPSGGTLTITGLGAHNGKVAHRLGL